MVLIETVSQKTKIRDSETSRPKIRETETRRNSRKRDFETHSKRLQDSEIGKKISETLNFPGTIRHPYIRDVVTFLHCLDFKYISLFVFFSLFDVKKEFKVVETPNQ